MNNDRSNQNEAKQQVSTDNHAQDGSKLVEIVAEWLYNDYEKYYHPTSRRIWNVQPKSVKLTFYDKARSLLLTLQQNGVVQKDENQTLPTLSEFSYNWTYQLALQDMVRVGFVRVKPLVEG